MADSLVGPIIGATVAMICVTTLVVSIRIGVRGSMKTYGIDDVLITISWLFSMAMFVQTLVSAHSALGHHHYNVNPGDHERFLKLAISTSSTYSYALALAKMSFAVLYLRMLPERRLIVINKFIIVFLCCQAIEESMIPIFQCRPIAKAWLPGISGRCLDLPVLWWVGFGFNLCTDLVLFIQPIPLLWRLRLPIIKRLGLIAMLSLGLMVCAVSVIRMHSATQMGLDDTYDLALPIIWSEAEVAALIVCSCVPSLRKAVQKTPWFNKAFHASTHDSQLPYPPTIGHLGKKRSHPMEDMGKGDFGRDSGLTGTTLTYPMSVLSRPARDSHAMNDDTEEILRISSTASDRLSSLANAEGGIGIEENKYVNVIRTPLQTYFLKPAGANTASGKA